MLRYTQTADGYGAFSLLNPNVPYQIHVDRVKRRLEKIKALLKKEQGSPRYIKRGMAMITPLMREFMEKAQIAAEVVYPGRIEIIPDLEVEWRLESVPTTYRYITYNYLAPLGNRYLEAGAGGDMARYERGIRYKCDSVSIRIHFPEITIRNSSDNTLEIKDMYISLMVSMTRHYNDKVTFIFNSMQGVRTTMAVEELAAKFVHSHQGEFDITKFGYHSFCLGYGILNEKLGSVAETDSMDGFMPILRWTLRQIKAYLEWESIEGVPHRYLADVIGKQSLDKLPVSNDLLVKAFDTIKIASPYNFSSLRWTATPSGYKIVDDANFDQLLKGQLQLALLHMVNDSGRLRGTPIVVEVDTEGNYFVRRDSQYDTEIKVHEDKYIWFKGEKRFLTVTGHAQVRNVRTRTVIHPKIKYYVKTRLENILNNAEVREAGARRLSQGINT